MCQACLLPELRCSNQWKVTRETSRDFPSVTFPLPPHLLPPVPLLPCVCICLSGTFCTHIIHICSLYLPDPLCFAMCPWEAGSEFAHTECQTPIPSQALGPDQCVTSLPTTLPQFNTWTGTSIQYSALWIQLSSQLQIHKTPALIQPTFHHLSHKETMKETVSPRLKSRPTMFMAFT